MINVKEEIAEVDSDEDFIGSNSSGSVTLDYDQ